MRLRRHLELLSNIIASRQDVTIDRFVIEEIVVDQQGIVEARLRFWDGSLLHFVEVLIEQGVILNKVDYVYHYQSQDGQLIFRYDNAPHHRHVSTFPHHKHTQQGIEPATPPHLGDVLREIDGRLYPEQ